jgi:hypothetical protein
MKWISDRKACGGCGVHRALFFTRQGRIRWDREHSLCVRCFQSLRDHVRVAPPTRMATVPMTRAA